jgi:hypothetical protein
MENPNPLASDLKPANVAGINLYAQLLHWLAQLLDARRQRLLAAPVVPFPAVAGIVTIAKAEVGFGSRAAVVARLTVWPVCPQLRNCPVCPDSYAWCQFRTSRSQPISSAEGTVPASGLGVFRDPTPGTGPRPRSGRCISASRISGPSTAPEYLAELSVPRPRCEF